MDLTQLPYFIVFSVLLVIIIFFVLILPTEMENVERRHMESCKFQCEEIGWEYYKSWEGGLWGKQSCYCKNLNESPPVLQVR